MVFTKFIRDILAIMRNDNKSNIICKLIATYNIKRKV